MKVICHACEKRHCEFSTNMPVKAGWEIICPLFSEEEGPMPADWRAKKDRGE